VITLQQISGKGCLLHISSLTRPFLGNASWEDDRPWSERQVEKFPVAGCALKTFTGEPPNEKAPKDAFHTGVREAR